MTQPSRRRKVAILAHRGTSLLAPENTLPAFEFACKHQADTLELDVRLTRDSALIVTHDATVDRTTNGRGKVADQTTKTLRQLDAAFHFGSKEGYPLREHGVQLVTLEEVLYRFADMGINIDIKDNSKVAVDILARVVGEADAASRVVVASFHASILRYCRKQYPWLTTSACAADVRDFLWLVVQRKHKRAKIPVSLFQLPRRHYFLSFDSRWFIDAVHEAGGQIHFWTVNDEAGIRCLINAGADGIVTDRADIASKILANSLALPTQTG